MRIKKIREDRFSGPIHCLALAASRGLAAVALNNGRVHVWRLDSGETVHDFAFAEPDSELRNIGYTVEPIRLHFAPDSSALAISFLGRIHLYQTTNWTETANLGVPGEDVVRPRKPPVLGRRPDHEENRTAKQMAEDHVKRRAQGDGAARITDMAFTPDGSRILAAYCRGEYFDESYHSYHFYFFSSGNDPVRLWDVRGSRLLWERIYRPGGAVERVFPSPDGRRFAAAPQSGPPQVCDLSSGEPLYSLPGVAHLFGQPPSVLFVQDGAQFITLSAAPGDNILRASGRLAIHDSRDGAEVGGFSERAGGYEADISHDGRWLAAVTTNGITFKIYDMQTRKVAFVERRQFPWGWRGPLAETVRFDPGGSYLVVASRAEGRVAVYQIAP
ncbi:MAG: WD40 repeat domain-containing protein [Acidobacteriia bacterium]|nr:WD40 repeat domain-containing protein [Terriglobia bacterium]